MALVVWLPLNGNLENQGCSNITITNNGATSNTAGKIGQCYSFSNNSIYGSIPNINNMTQMSGCCWLYLTNTNSAQYIFHIGGQNSWQCKFSLDYEGDIRSIINGKEYRSGITLTTNTWYHVCVVWDGMTVTWYLNGVKQTSKSTSGTFSASNNYAIGARTNSTAGNTFAYYITNAGKLNDIRIYDHCLSAAEVHEISQGLVLHYKLDSIGSLHGSENFILESHKVTSGGNASGITRTYMDDGSLKIIAASGNGNYASIGFAKNSNDNVGVKLAVGDTYTLSCDIKVESGTALPTVFINSGNGYKRLQGNFTLGQWIQVYYTSTWANPGTGYGNISLHLGFSGLVGTYYFRNFKLEKSSTPTFWCPSPLDDNYNSYMPTSVFDSSGYGHNGAITGNITINSSTPRYNSSTNFPDSACSIRIGNLSTMAPEGIFTFNIWFKKITGEWSSKTWETILGGPSGFEFEGKLAGSQNAYIHPYSWGGGSTSSPNSYSIAYTLDTWHMVTMVRTSANTQFYLDGELKVTGSAGSIPSGNYFIGAWNSATQQNYRGYFSDARIYCTALSAADVKQLYEMGAKVDNRGGLHAYEAKEHTSNILFKVDSARAEKVLQNGLSKFTQSNCQVTLTDEGYRIYRPPNVNPTNNGNTMWGGLKLVNQSSDTVSPYNAIRDNIWGLETGHTYLLAFHVKGKSNNSATIGFTNNMGWGIGGVSPSPTIISRVGIPQNFNGEMDCYCIFKINDNIVKTSSDARGGYDGSSQYLSYRHVTFGFDYTNTGEMGTDIYLTNFRLYDVSSYKAQFIKQGIANFYDFVEDDNMFKIRKNSEAKTSNLIEI